MALWIESFSPHGITQFSLYEGASNKIIIWVDRLKQSWQSRLIKATAWWKNTKEDFKVYYFKVPWFDEERFTVPLSSISFFVSDFYWSEQFWCKLHQCPWRAVECVTVFVDFNFSGCRHILATLREEYARFCVAFLSRHLENHVTRDESVLSLRFPDRSC